MAKFKIGDRVVAKENAPYSITTNGWKGTVVEVGKDNNIRVKGKDGIGVMRHFWVVSKYFDLDTNENQRIVITTDGKTTTARLYSGKNVVKSAETKCSPDDEFDFKTGAVIAFTRLMDGELKFKEKSKVEGLDWKAFKAYKIAVKVTKDNYKNFVTAARKHGCDWYDGSDFNPFKCRADDFFRALMKPEIATDEIYICAYGDVLKMGHFLGDMKEFVWK